MLSGEIEIIKNGGVGVIPTDTLYGLVGRALDEKAVAQIVKIKNRSDGKGFIVLISSVEDLKIFGAEVTKTVSEFLQKYWPGPVSIILPVIDSKFDYLKKDRAIAFRLPAKTDLLEILKETGPLIAPSANPEGLSPAKNIEEAKKYFADKVDFYLDGGTLDSSPSTLVRIVGDKVEILRQGGVRIIP